jgi:DNA-binding CsgD family transcriptional regulator
MFSIASDANKAELDKRLSEFGQELIAFGFCLHVMASKLVCRSGQQHSNGELLSTREKDCLLWSVKGKTAWEIAAILNISERTVRFHINNAKRKLGTASHREAIAKAILERHIEP